MENVNWFSKAEDEEDAEAEEGQEKKEKEDFVEYKVQYKIVNPKSISLVQLYGSYDAQTNEWADGIIGK